MSYSSGEALILTKVQACTGFDSTNTARANWKLLNQGKSSHYAILRPGGFTNEWIAANRYRANWTTVVEVWEHYTDDATTQANLYSRIANLLAGLMSSLALGDTTGTVQFTGVIGADEPTQQWKRGGGPQWLRWDLRVLWSEIVEVTFS